MVSERGLQVLRAIARDTTSPTGADTTGGGSVPVLTAMSEGFDSGTSGILPPTRSGWLPVTRRGPVRRSPTRMHDCLSG